MCYEKQPDEGFRHLADAHRHLVEAVYARVEADLPHDAVSGVSHEAAGLIYGRAALEFYLGTSARADDITKADLGIVYSPTPNDEQVLATVKALIDKHLAHLTWIRDPAHPK